MGKILATTLSVSIHDVRENPIFGEHITELRIDDECGGAYFRLIQDSGEIRLELDEIRQIYSRAVQLEEDLAVVQKAGDLMAGKEDKETHSAEDIAEMANEGFFGLSNPLKRDEALAEHGVMDELVYDMDEYLTDESLKYIRNFTGDFEALLSILQPYFSKHGRGESEGGAWEFATGGWSGCEDVIVSLKANKLFWLQCWRASKRGGVYSFYTSE